MLAQCVYLHHQVNAICLFLAYDCVFLNEHDLGIEQCESELVREVRQGVYKTILPETLNDLQIAINAMYMKKLFLPQILLNGLLHSRLPFLAEHKKSNERHLNE